MSNPSSGGQFRGIHRVESQGARDERKKLSRLGNMAGIRAPGDRKEMETGYRKAIELLQGELQVNPRSGELYSYLAHYQAPLGDRAEAIANMKKAIEIESSNPVLWHRSAETWISLGDEEEAIRALRSAVNYGFRLNTLPPSSRLYSMRDRICYTARDPPRTRCRSPAHPVRFLLPLVPMGDTLINHGTRKLSTNLHFEGKKAEGF